MTFQTLNKGCDEMSSSLYFLWVLSTAESNKDIYAENQHRMVFGC